MASGASSTVCPLCRFVGVEATSLINEDVDRVICRRCGTFEIDGMAWAAYKDHPSRTLDQNRYLLSGQARTSTLGGKVARFMIGDIGNAEHGRLAKKDLSEKIRLMLQWFERTSTKFGEWLSPVSSLDYPAAYCVDEGEWTALIHSLTHEGLLESHGQQFRITLAGRRKLAESASSSHANK